MHRGCFAASLLATTGLSPFASSAIREALAGNPVPEKEATTMVNEPSRQPAARTESGDDRPRRVRTLLQGGATLAAALVAIALPAPKLPPLQGD
jgi:hypothetical protein